jgi:carboxypeptidase PM20D1
MKKLLGFAGLLTALLVLLVLGKTFLMTSKQAPAVAPMDIRVDRDGAAQHLSSAVRFQTVSHEDTAYTNAAQNQAGEFSGLHRYLERTYTGLHSVLTKEVVGGSSLLYTWQGRNPALKPILLLAHMDVVPVESGTEGAWTYPPFEGQIAEGYVWGRGALDNKASMIGIMEAVEMLIAEGFQPERTIFLGLGHDEELGGQAGAYAMAQLLSSRGVELEYTLDEGLSITDGIVPSLSQPAALIGVAHKGYVSVELVVDGQTGHAAMPPPQTAIGILSAAVARLESHPMPARRDGPGTLTTQYLAPEMSFAMKMVFANQWLFGGLVEKQMSAKASTNASIRTTTAATIFEAGVRDNVLPSRAQAVVNFRMLPGDSIGAVLEHVRKTVADPRVQVRALPGSSEPSPVSDAEGFGYRAIERALRSVFPEVLVAPGLMTARADIRHFEALSANSYRFVPSWLRPEDVDRVHGLNERISAENFERLVRFYFALVKDSAGT